MQSGWRQLKDCYLYGILDLAYVSREKAMDMARVMVKSGVDILQLRAKNVAEDEIERLATQLHPITADGEIALVINDHPRLAAKVQAEALHLGQDDGSLEDARAIVGSQMIIGRSTHSLQQARDAVEEGADYIGFGPLYATPTKAEYIPIGLNDITAVHEEVDLPIFCIGGIKADNLPAVLEKGARRVVIVSGILQAEDIPGYIKKVRQQLRPEHIK